ncbi:hypothetical protein AMR41_26345 [Hapalosiphon sp. MRB220]|nr:hypothetical protein AMR41_26345 [Hapalosiphon sp. MRB220]
MSLTIPPEETLPSIDSTLLTGLTQQQFAATLGVTYLTINRWENGRAKPSPLVMQKIEMQLQEIGKQGKDLLEKYWRSI